MTVNYKNQINEIPKNRGLVQQDIKLELNKLEDKFALLKEEKIECETQINNFNSTYMLRLGSLIEEILRMRVIIYENFHSNFNVNKIQLFENAKLHYEEFKETFRQQLKDLPQLLDNSEKLQIKLAYRKASRLCHPDKLDDNLKAKGEEFFKELNEAYRHQDLNRVQSILLKLESNEHFSEIDSNNNNDRILLQQKIIFLYEQITLLEPEIKCLQESEIYLRIQAITNMDIYFSNIEKELKAELKVLKSKKHVI